MAGREEAIIDVFERNTYSVANIFDITLQVCCNGARAPSPTLFCSAHAQPLSAELGYYPERGKMLLLCSPATAAYPLMYAGGIGEISVSGDARGQRHRLHLGRSGDARPLGKVLGAVNVCKRQCQPVTLTKFKVSVRISRGRW